MADVNLESEARKMCCASCGTAEVDDVKLKLCSDNHFGGLGCDLVRYCSDKCQEDHWLQHESECTERMIELHGETEVREWIFELEQIKDEILFEQPESSHHGDCPICCLPLYPFTDQRANTSMSCCGKIVCSGCARRILDGGTCPFCRLPLPKTAEEYDRNETKRAERNDPASMHHIGASCYREGDYKSAFEYLTKATHRHDGDSSVWNAEAHLRLGHMYFDGKGVEMDPHEAQRHYEAAAMQGHPNARHILAMAEEMKGRIDRAVKHFVINANLGYDKSIQALMKHYKDGAICKDEYARALRSYQAAVDATKSPQREAALKIVVRRKNSNGGFRNVFHL